ncbi:MAG TPA: glycoside hydrolase family 172 protein [Sphingomonas sp.]|jgi:hypothetical protein|uniref:glycoside hydrolase family 172 protein n=1 Tax=Sphingomonas sp. TaxID=28214 RepID=UPI002ED89184
MGVVAGVMHERAWLTAAILAVGLVAGPGTASAQSTERGSLHRFDPSGRPAWTSPENPTGAKGAGGRENRGGKGHAFETIAAGASHVLADIRDAGIIDRMWMTIDDRSPERLRALVLDIYWDGAATPAVSVPLGDFFLHGAGEMRPMETDLLSSAEGRSFISYIPMPFRRGARVVMRNESDKQLNLLFFDINHRRVAVQPADAMYFHAWWTRDRATRIGDAHDVLPRLSGRGRFVGASFTVLTNPVYEKSWWGEGEVKIALDGDGDTSSLIGTGAEDYIGTAWGQGAFINRYQGAPVSDEAAGRWTFYRFHVPDPIFFDRDVKVELQQIGGWPKGEVMRLQRQGAPMLPVTIDPGSRVDFRRLLDGAAPVPLTTPGLPEGWTNFYRSDDVASVAYFYLDRPENGLPRIAPVAQRLAGLRKPAPTGAPTAVQAYTPPAP